MIIILSILALIIIILVIGKINLSVRFANEVKELFDHSKNISERKFSYEQLIGLPEPVQRYFKQVLKEGQPYISYVRLKHDGQFKTGVGKDWIKIKGEQYFTTEKPGFIWKGTTSMMTARDKYIGDKGRLVVSLLSLVNVVNAKGEKYNEGELQRWLSEGVWFPTNLFPNEYLQWAPIDSLSAKLTFNYKDISIFYIVTFNEAGEITQMETKRYMTEKNKETWIGKFNDCKELNGILVPTSIEAIYRLEKGDFSYAKFTVKEIEYDQPEKF
jgi:hypothetical protein